MATPEVSKIPQLSPAEQIVESTRLALPQFPQEAVTGYKELLDMIKQKAPAQTLSITTYYEWGAARTAVLDIKLWRLRQGITQQEAVDFHDIGRKYAEVADVVHKYLDFDLNLFYTNNPESLPREHVLIGLGSDMGRKPRAESVQILELARIR